MNIYQRRSVVDYVISGVTSDGTEDVWRGRLWSNLNS